MAICLASTSVLGSYSLQRWLDMKIYKIYKIRKYFLVLLIQQKVDGWCHRMRMAEIWDRGVWRWLW